MHSKPSIVHQEPKKSGLEQQQSEFVSLRHQPATRNGRSTPGLFTSVEREHAPRYLSLSQNRARNASILVAYLRGGSSFSVKLKSSIRARSRRKLCTFHFYRIWPRLHRSKWYGFTMVDFICTKERQLSRAIAKKQNK